MAYSHKVQVVWQRLTEESRTGRTMQVHELAAETGLDVRTVKWALKQLDEAGDALYDGFAWTSLAPGERPKRTRSGKASREEQHGRYLDCGPSNWDDR